MQKLKPLYKLTELREAKGLTQSDLAEKAKVSRPLITNIERGYANPSLYVAHRISLALDSTIDVIFFGKNVHKTSVDVDSKSSSA